MARLIVGGIACSLALLGIAMRAGADPTPSQSGASVALGAAGAAAGLAVLPFPYVVRAAASTLLGVFLLGLGVVGAGPLGALALDGEQTNNVARAIALLFLPAALLFRARYRAYPRARLVLSVGLVAALPFAVASGLVLANVGAPLLERAGAAVDIGVLLSGLFGFMGADTTGGGSVWAALVLTVLPANVLLTELDVIRHHLANHVGWLACGGAAVGTAAAAALATIGTYQTLAAWLGRDARLDAKLRQGAA